MRHMESEANLLHKLIRAGVQIDPELLQQIRSRPDYAHRLSERGPAQAKKTGQWITKYLIQAYPELANGFDTCRTSPYDRCKESVGGLLVPQLGPFMPEMRLRERDRGEEGPLTQDEHRALFPASALRYDDNPLMWTPPGSGDSMDNFITARIRSLLGAIRRSHEEEGAHSFFGSTHGEWMWGLEAALFNWGPEEWAVETQRPEKYLSNGSMLHLVPFNPITNGPSDSFYIRRLRPLQDDAPQDWVKVAVPSFTPAELLEQAQARPRIFPPGMLTGLAEQHL